MRILKIIRFNERFGKVIFVLNLLAICYLQIVICGPAKLVLFQGSKRFEISSMQCSAGIYTKEPMRFTCACVTGV